MKKNKIDFSSKVMLLWALMNLAMMPLAFAAPDPQVSSSTFDAKSMSTTTFSKVTPLVLEVHNNKSLFSYPDLGSAKSFFIFMCFMMIACLGLSHKFKLSKKSQITVFILIVLVLGIIFGFMFYLKNQSTGKSIEQEREKVFTEFMEASGFQVYMQNCIDKTTADGIELLGMQGGYIYYNFPNDNITFDFKSPYYDVNAAQITSPNPWHIPDLNDPYTGPAKYYWPYDGNVYAKNYFGELAVPFDYTTPSKSYIPTVQYSIRGNGTSYSGPFYKPPLYPYGNYNSSFKSPAGYDDMPDVLGLTDNYLSPLCNNYSMFHGNELQQYFADRNILYQCETYRAVGLGYPMDMKLADFVRGHIDDCYLELVSNFNPNTSGSKLFEDMMMLNVTVNSTAIQTYAVIGENDVTVFVDMPMNVKVREDTTFEKTIEFSSRKNVRLRYTYDLAEALINRESRDIFFMLSSSSLNTRLGNVCREYIENATSSNIERRRLLTDCVKDNMRVNISRNIDKHSCDNPGINFLGYTPAPEISLHCKSASVVRIEDNASFVNEYPFVFLFAIENRAPALNYIDRKVLDNTNSTGLYDQISYQYINQYTGGTPDPHAVYEASTIGTYIEDSSYTSRDFRKNIIVTVGYPVVIIPFAIDPDDPESNVSDNNINYTYEGWKSDKPIDLSKGNLSFDINSTDNLPLQTLDLYREPYALGVLNSTDTNSLVNIWENSEYYKGNYSGGFLHTNSSYLESIKTTLASYGFYNVYRHNFIYKDGYYNTTPADTGYHWVRVYARDKNEPDSLYDYQDVLIQVRCIPAENPCCNDTTDFHFDPNRCSGYCHGGTKRCTYTGCCDDSNNDGTADNPLNCVYDKSLGYDPLLCP